MHGDSGKNDTKPIATCRDSGRDYKKTFMPIISPNVQEALRQSGLVKDPGEKRTIDEMMDACGLSLAETLQNLSDVATGADTSSAKLRANEIAFKLRGVLKETAPPPPSFNIIIQDSGSENTINGIDRILIPRPESVQ